VVQLYVYRYEKGRVFGIPRPFSLLIKPSEKVANLSRIRVPTAGKNQHTDEADERTIGFSLIYQNYRELALLISPLDRQYWLETLAWQPWVKSLKDSHRLRWQSATDFAKILAHKEPANCLIANSRSGV